MNGLRARVGMTHVIDGIAASGVYDGEYIDYIAAIVAKVALVVIATTFATCTLATCTRVTPSFPTSTCEYL